MKLKEMETVLVSPRGNITRTIVYDLETDTDLEYGCSVEYAVATYSDREVKRISAAYVNGYSCLVITI